METTPLIEVKDLKKYFPVTSGLLSKVTGHIKAVDGVSLTVNEGETLGLVGESGCGKTTAGRSILRLIEPTSGTVTYKGDNFYDLKGEEMRKMRRKLQIIFQDPYSSLNPKIKVLDIVGEAPVVHKMISKNEKEDRVVEVLKKVGLSEDALNKYPHEFSGGQRQRICIARAIALNPSFIVCDEPVSALDVSIQAQIVNLLIELQEELKLSYLFIAHDLSVVKHISNRVAVMYLGKIVETAPSEELFKNPTHPYTKALMSAIPQPDPGRTSKRIVLAGEVPSPSNPPSGCPFHPRCPIAENICSTQRQSLDQKGRGKEHLAACWKCMDNCPPSDNRMFAEAC